MTLVKEHPRHFSFWVEEVENFAQCGLFPISMIFLFFYKISYCGGILIKFFLAFFDQVFSEKVASLNFAVKLFLFENVIYMLDSISNDLN